MKTLRTMMVMVTVIVTLMANGLTANAGVREDVREAKFYKEFNEEWNDAYEQFKTAKEEGDEDAKLIKDLKMDIKAVGINVYDIHMVMEMEDGTNIEAHVFYDAVEEEYFAEYYQIGNERLSSEEFDELYPDSMIF